MFHPPFFGRKYIMKIIEEEAKEFWLVYEDKQGCGYSFPCDNKGHILWEKCLSPETTERSLAYCKANPDKWTPRTRDGLVVKIIHRVRYGVCPACGRRVYLGGSGWASYLGTAECECGQWYTVFGQAIKPPEEWEET